MANETTTLPVNILLPTGRLLYRYSMTKGGAFRVNAGYTGLPTGCIGSAGKSFATAEERDAATLATCERYMAARGHKNGSALVRAE
jgi:hypothetical protein